MKDNLHFTNGFDTAKECRLSAGLNKTLEKFVKLFKSPLERNATSLIDGSE